MSITRAVWLFVAALTAIRFSLLATTDLSFDEAHYWMWSERLAPAYFSKGPGIAFAIRASTAIFGANEFGVRFFSPVLAAGTSLILFYFARRLFGATPGTPEDALEPMLQSVEAQSLFNPAQRRASYASLQEVEVLRGCAPGGRDRCSGRCRDRRSPGLRLVSSERGAGA